MNYLLSYIVGPTSSGADASLSDAEVVEHLAVRTFRAVGELYRWSLAKSSDNTRVAFGKKGLDMMDEMRQRFSLESQQILQIMTTYRGVADDLDDPAKRNELPLFNNITSLGLGVRDFSSAGAGVTWAIPNPLADALPLAARNGWEEAVSAMLEMGADPNARDGEGRSTISYYKELGNEICLEILIANGASDEDATSEVSTVCHKEAQPPSPSPSTSLAAFLSYLFCRL